MARFVSILSSCRRYFSSVKIKKKPIISCKRAEFDHFPGQTYSKFDGIPLASQGWQHKKSRGDYFTIYPDSNKCLEEECAPKYIKTFEDLLIENDFIDVLTEQGILRPTAIQRKAIPSILLGHNTLLTAETGCGKTLAYLLPILQHIYTWKTQKGNEEINSPLAVVLTPERELTKQISDVATNIGKHFSINVRSLIGGSTKKKMLNPPAEYCDLLVASLGAFSKLVTTGIYKIRNVRHIVLDEADTLLDDSFIDQVAHLLKKFPIQYKSDTKAESLGCQVTMVSATMPRELPETVSVFMDPDSLKKITTINIHKLLPHVPQKFMRLGKAEKPLELLKLINADVNTKSPVMIFSTKADTCDWVSMFLSENNIENLNINGRMAVALKEGRYEQYKSGKINVLSCTDIAARGLDTCRTQHVLNYDFPLYTADYIHRCGRTGRLGSPAGCHVTNFIAWPREVELVQKIEMSVRKDGDLPAVNANIRRIFMNRRTHNINRDLKQMNG